MSEPFDSQGLDSSAPVGDSGESSSPAITTQPGGEQQQSSYNPAWDPFLADLPEFFHTKAKGHFKTWDENYNKLDTSYKELQERYSPYEQYLGVDPQQLGYAVNVLNAINSNPKHVHQLLTEQLKQAGLLDEPQSTPPDPTTLEEQNPEYKALDDRTRMLDERQRQFDTYIQQQQYDQQVSKFEQDIDKQVQSVVGKYGDVVDLEDLMQRMYVQSQQGQPFNAEAAFNEQKTVFQRIYGRQSTNGRPAPRIIPTTGTPAPSSEKRPEDMNEDERKTYFKQLLDIANSGG